MACIERRSILTCIFINNHLFKLYLLNNSSFFPTDLQCHRVPISKLHTCMGHFLGYLFYSICYIVYSCVCTNILITITPQHKLYLIRFISLLLIGSSFYISEVIKVWELLVKGNALTVFVGDRSIR